MSLKKERLDKYLVTCGFYESRELAKKAIMAGLVVVHDKPNVKPGEQIPVDFPPEHICIKGNPIPYVSRGGLKLEKGLSVFDFPTEGRVFIDIGASTGGFTDCLLQNGAKRVYAVDVGYGQLSYKLREDSRVVSLERTNFRNIETDAIPEVIDGTVMDVSFISITKLLPALKRFVAQNALGIWLIKPQFEAGREAVGKHGVIRDPAVHRSVLQEVTSSIQEAGFEVLGLAVSPIKGPAGNIEFLCYTRFSDSSEVGQKALPIAAVVTEAHRIKE